MKAIGDSILFKFVQNVDTSNFENKLDWGLVIKAPTEDSAQPRWAIVESIGDDVNGLSIGDYILIEPLMWTNFVEHSGSKYWRTTSDKVIISNSSLVENIY